jgi:plasmid stability protein
LSKTGQTKSERYDDSIESERAELLHAALKKLEERKPAGLHRIASDLGLTMELVQAITGYSANSLPKNVVLLRA